LYRDTAIDIYDNNAIVIAASNQSEINTNTIECGQGTTPEAFTAFTAFTVEETGNDSVDTPISLPSTKALPQTGSETIRNAGEIYWSGSNWHCRQCKLYGDKFYMEGHICKGYLPM
jgi:hypothetical protein